MLTSTNHIHVHIPTPRALDETFADDYRVYLVFGSTRQARESSGIHLTSIAQVKVAQMCDLYFYTVVC